MSTIKTGTHISREKTTFKNNKNKLDNDYYGNLPHGAIPLSLNILFFIGILLCGIFIPNERLYWTGAFVIASYTSFCMNLFWMISRQDFFRSGRFQLFSMWRKSFGYKMKERIKSNDVDFKKNISDVKEYNLFIEKRKDKTNLLFWISFCIHLLLVIISSILILAIK